MNYLSIITNHIIYHYQRLWKPLLTTTKNHCHHPVTQWPGLGPVVFHVGKTNSPEPPGIGTCNHGGLTGGWLLMIVLHNLFYLVGGLNSSEKYESTGMIIPNIWENQKCSEPPTSLPCFTHIPLLLQPLDPKCIPDQLRPGSIFLSQLTFGVSFGFCRLLATTSWEPFAISEMTSHGIETMGEAVQ